MTGRRGPKRTVTYGDATYKVKSDKIEIPDFTTMTRSEALSWLCRETYPRGYSRPNPLAGFAGAVNVRVR